LIIIPLQFVVFSIVPLPATVLEWFELFQKNGLVAFFHADLFILIDNVCIAVIYLAFYHTLKDTNKGLLQIGVLLGWIGIAAYISSNPTFELLALSNAYAAAGSSEARLVLEAAGKAALVGWQGTAFDAYYVLNGIALLIVSLLMAKSTVYDKVTARWGLASAILMTIPSTAGIVGIIFSLLSLVPWYVFSIRFARIFRRLASPTASVGETPNLER
jgi:hypothetical protein